MKPGDIFTADFRPARPNVGVARHEAQREGLRIVQWNIERGYELDKIIAELKAIDADILGIQEIDIGCERSNFKDTGVAIAEALQLNYAFVCEFEELHSPLRTARSQGGGFHGNAILSKMDIQDARAIEHRCHPVDWENPQHPLAKKEPRKGRRLSIAATVLTPQGPLICYSCHLEVFCGMLARISQFSDILKDSREQIEKGYYCQAILGDLNTMGHGIARWSPSFCCDQMRFRSWGLTEAEFWDLNIMQQSDPAFALEKDGQKAAALPPHGKLLNANLQRYGVPEDVCRDALNPGFSDPFDPVKTITLDNKDYRYFGISLMEGKLDWLLLRRCRVLAKDVGNHDYSASDHKWLSVDVQFE